MSAMEFLIGDLERIYWSLAILGFVQAGQLGLIWWLYRRQTTADFSRSWRR
jgi:ABC-type phosphate/phosphonate transport system permease subunit